LHAAHSPAFIPEWIKQRGIINTIHVDDVFRVRYIFYTHLDFSAGELTFANERANHFLGASGEIASFPLSFPLFYYSCCSEKGFLSNDVSVIN